MLPTAFAQLAHDRPLFQKYWLLSPSRRALRVRKGPCRQETGHLQENDPPHSLPTNVWGVSACLGSLPPRLSGPPAQGSRCVSVLEPINQSRVLASKRL